MHGHNYTPLGACSRASILHSHLSICFCLGIRAILVLKMGIENSNFFFIQSFFNKNYQFTPKIVVLEHWDHFFWIPRVISDQNTLFSMKKNWRWGIFHHINFVNFFPLFFTTTTTPLQIFQFCCKQIVA